MRSRMKGVLLSLALVLSPLAAARGQQAGLSPEEAQIRQYRDEIRLLSAKSPPAETQEAYRRNLLSLRRKLHDLLLEKRGALKKDISDLQSPNASAEFQDYVKQLQNALQGVNSEIEGLDRDLEQGASLAAAGPASPAPSPTESPSPTPLPTPSDEQIAVLAAAKEIADKQLNSPEGVKNAAAPAEVAASALASRPCNEAGLPVPVAGASEYDKSVCRMANDILLRREVNRRVILLSQDQAAVYSILIVKLLKTRGDSSYAAFVAEAQEARTDQQMGAGPSSSGTTSLVSKGGIPYALGFAVENGAATQTVSDTTVTFRINPVGTFKLLADKGFITGFKQSEKDPLLKFFRKTAVGLTFDTSRGDQPGVFTGRGQQLSEVSVKVEFVNERDPRLPKYEKKWEAFVATEGVKLARQIYATTVGTLGFKTNALVTFRDPALQAWLDKTNERLAGIDQGMSLADKTGAAAKIIREQADLLPVNLVSDETVGFINSFARQFQAYTLEKKKLLDEIAKGNVFTFEYTNKREVNAPDTSNFRFVAARGMQTVGRTLDFTANGSLTFFHSRPAPATPGGPRPGRVRDFQFAGQADVPFKVRNFGQFVFWFSGRYERLMEDASTQAGTTVPGTRGDIAVGQFGLKVPIPGLGMQLPISFTVANRTELIKEKEVRGNFGFTFNLDSILARFKPF